MAPAWVGLMLPALQGLKTQVYSGGIPQSMKWVQVPDPDKAGPSKDALFLESELGKEAEDWAVTVESKAPLAGLAELVGAIRAQTDVLQGQLTTQEWLARKLECVAVALDRHCAAVEELLEAFFILFYIILLIQFIVHWGGPYVGLHIHFQAIYLFL